MKNRAIEVEKILETVNGEVSSEKYYFEHLKLQYETLHDRMKYCDSQVLKLFSGLLVIDGAIFVSLEQLTDHFGYYVLIAGTMFWLMMMRLSIFIKYSRKNLDEIEKKLNLLHPKFVLNYSVPEKFGKTGLRTSVVASWGIALLTICTAVLIFYQ